MNTQTPILLVINYLVDTMKSVARTETPIQTLVDETSSYFQRRGFAWCRVGWSDAQRSQHSCLGPNINDTTFQIREGTEALPFLRRPNYADKTMTIHARDLAISVETPDGYLKAVTFQEYLTNFGLYTPGLPDHIQLHAGPNELVTVRTQVVVMPVGADGSQEVVPTSYSYGTTDAKNPQNIVGTASHLGTGVHLEGVGTEKIYLVERTGTKPTQGVSTEEGWPDQMSSGLRQALQDEPFKYQSFLEVLHRLNDTNLLDAFGYDSVLQIESSDQALRPEYLVELATFTHGLDPRQNWTRQRDGTTVLRNAFYRWAEPHTTPTWDSSKGSTYQNAWARITAADQETPEQQQQVASVLGGRAMGTGRNRVMMFQIPRQQPEPEPETLYRGLCAKGAFLEGNVSFGTAAGSHQLDQDISYVRNKEQNVTITLTTYYTTQDGHLSPEQQQQIADSLDASYRDPKSAWVGSLVTGEAEAGHTTSAPITLPEPTQADVDQFHTKVTLFPKTAGDVTNFPC
jgi:hypothetical protein